MTSQIPTQREEFDQKIVLRWPEAPKAGDNVVRLRESANGEPPLIVIHGGGGAIHAFGPLRDKFRTGVWGIQVTPDTPLNNLDSQVEHYYRKIKEQQPRGPYRLAAFSASSLMVYALALRFESSGDEVIQLATIDHFPFVFFCPIIGLDPAKDDLDDMPDIRRVFHTVSIENLCAMTRRDGGGGIPKRMQLAKELTEAHNGSPPTEFSRLFYQTLQGFLNGILDHIRTLPNRMLPALPPSVALKSKGDILTECFLSWIRLVKAVPTVYVASYGMQGSIPRGLEEEWQDLGARRAVPDAKVVHLHAGHYDILANDALIESLQEGFLSWPHAAVATTMQAKL